MGLAISVVMAVACSASGSGDSGGGSAVEPRGLQPVSGAGVADRHILGLFSHHVAN
ncbi:MAG: hypothetical protein KKF66_06975 [Actinobacteria bacterium]|nr:hypothetical protein [Actinomycetota bacterium]